MYSTSQKMLTYIWYGLLLVHPWYTRGLLEVCMLLIRLKFAPGTLEVWSLYIQGSLLVHLRFAPGTLEFAPGALMVRSWFAFGKVYTVC